MDDAYIGILVADAFWDPGAFAAFTPVARRHFGAWDLILVRCAPERLSAQVAALQAGMRQDDTWYCHFFRGDELLVVFGGRIFHITCFPQVNDGSRGD